jgi:hypothetical protein
MDEETGGQGARGWLDVLGAMRVNLAVGTAYFLAAVACATAVAIYATDPAASTTPALLFSVAVSTSALHGVFSVIAKACIPNYVYFAVEPGWAFVLADLLQGVALGAALIGYLSDSSDATEPLVAATILIACHGLMVYKSAVIAWDVHKDLRDAITGAPLGRSGSPLQRVGY